MAQTNKFPQNVTMQIATRINESARFFEVGGRWHIPRSELLEALVWATGKWFELSPDISIPSLRKMLRARSCRVKERFAVSQMFNLDTVASWQCSIVF